MKVCQGNSKIDLPELCLSGVGGVMSILMCSSVSGLLIGGQTNKTRMQFLFC